MEISRPHRMEACLGRRARAKNVQGSNSNDGPISDGPATPHSSNMYLDYYKYEINVSGQVRCVLATKYQQ